MYRARHIAKNVVRAARGRGLFVAVYDDDPDTGDIDPRDTDALVLALEEGHGRATVRVAGHRQEILGWFVIDPEGHTFLEAWGNQADELLNEGFARAATPFGVLR